jgi:periplasmic copper chaperone A
MRAAFPAFLAALALSATAFGAEKTQVAAREPVIRPAGPGLSDTAAYLTLDNPTATPVKVETVSCGCAEMVEPHRSEMTGGVMRMRSAPAPVVPAHGSLVFSPGGLHLMVMGLKRPIVAGDHVPMRFSFDHGPPATIDFVARR